MMSMPTILSALVLLFGALYFAIYRDHSINVGLHLRSKSRRKRR